LNEPAPASHNLPIPHGDLRFCVIGASSFLGAAVDALLQAGIKVVSIASQSLLDQPDGPIEAYLATKGLHESAGGIVSRLRLPFVHTPDPNDAAAIAAIKQTGANAILSVSAPIIPANFLEAFDGLVFNIHGSKRYRGRAGLSWLILNDDRLCEDAWVLHWIDGGIDTGAAIVEQPFTWPTTAYPIDIMSAQRASIPALIAAFNAALATNSVKSRPQANARPYFPALKTYVDGTIDWHWTASEIERCVRAFGWPYAGAKTILVSPDRERRREIQIARVRIGTSANLHPLACGVVLAHNKNGSAEIACRDGSVIVETIRDGTGERPAGDVIRVGCRLGGKY
jgi:methionyl-tRNA formyltransferase